MLCGEVGPGEERARGQRLPLLIRDPQEMAALGLSAMRCPAQARCTLGDVQSG